jgi:hypothetical protein
LFFFFSFSFSLIAACRFISVRCSMGQGQSRKAKKAWAEELAPPPPSRTEIKVVFLGTGGSGKTTMRLALPCAQKEEFLRKVSMKQGWEVVERILDEDDNNHSLGSMTLELEPDWAASASEQ